MVDCHISSLFHFSTVRCTAADFCLISYVIVPICLDDFCQCSQYIHCLDTSPLSGSYLYSSVYGMAAVYSVFRIERFQFIH